MRDRQTAIENSMSGLAQKLDIILQKMGAPAGQTSATSTSATSHVSSPAAREAVSGQASSLPAREAVSGQPRDTVSQPLGLVGEVGQSDEVKAGLDRLMQRLNAAQHVLDSDRKENLSTDATLGSSSLRSAASPMPGVSGANPPPNSSHDAGRRIQQLEEEAVSPKDAALAHLRRYQDIDGFKIGGDATVRVAPSMVAKLYKNGRTASRELDEFVRSRGLERCHSATELPTLGLILDRLVVDSASSEVINMPAVEVVCRKIYGLIGAFEDVKSESDWKMPKGANAGKWKSKVKWTLLQEYDVKFLDSSDWSIPEADREVSDRLQKRALFNKHLSSSEPDSSAVAGE
jgi:hypothetical protein